MIITQDILSKARENYYRFIMNKFNFTVNTEDKFRNEILRFITYFKQISPFINGTCFNVVESVKVVDFFTNLRMKNKDLSLEYSIRLNHIKKCFESGMNMLDYCSKRYLDQEKLDLLWLHWNIYHLHFKSTSDGRTDYVIFAMIKDNNIYMIDIKQHGSWTDQELLCTVDKNWPQLLIRPNSEIQGNVLTNEEIQVLRNIGCNTLLQLPTGSNIMANSGVMGNLYHTETFYEMRIEQRYIENIYSALRDSNFKDLTPQYLHFDRDNWAIIALDKNLTTFDLYYHGNIHLIIKELQMIGILEQTSKTVTITDIALNLL